MKFVKKSITSGHLHSDGAHQQGIVALIAKISASGLGAGYAPWAQGTLGSLWIPLLYMIVPWDTISMPTAISPYLLPVLTLIIYVLGVWSAGVCERFWGHDPGRVVIDEVAGMLVTVLFMPLSITTVWAGFLLFRAFDILKPPPVRNAERMPGGWGVMNDDILAGVYANIILRVLLMLRG